VSFSGPEPRFPASREGLNRGRIFLFDFFFSFLFSGDSSAWGSAGATASSGDSSRNRSCDGGGDHLDEALASGRAVGCELLFLVDVNGFFFFGGRRHPPSGWRPPSLLRLR